VTLIFFLIFLLVGLKEACMPNFSFLGSYFTTSPDGRADGRLGRRPAGLLEESKIRLTQPSLAGTGAELGNMENSTPKGKGPDCFVLVFYKYFSLALYEI
jgi:hypothetical protein